MNPNEPAMGVRADFEKALLEFGDYDKYPERIDDVHAYALLGAKWAFERCSEITTQELRKAQGVAYENACIIIKSEILRLAQELQS